MATDTSSARRTVEQMLARAQAFTEKLLAENSRLRQALAAAHASTVGSQRTVSSSTREAELAKQLEEAKVRVAALERSRTSQEPQQDRLVRLESELAELKRRHAELEQQNSNLANLYVASHQLHSTLDFREVVAIVMEIVINLIGAEVFSIMLIDGKSEELCVVTAEGMERQPTARIRVGDGVIGRAAKEGKAHYRSPSEESPVDFMHPMAVIPLKIKDHVIGVISVYRLFAQKEGFAPLDYELFDMLAGHAATAIFSSKLYSESERKLTTIQSFLDLLTTS